MYVIRIYDRRAKLLAELNRATNVSAGYSINGGKQLTFDLTTEDSKTTLENLDRGNIVVAYHDQIEAWSGHILRRDWNKDTLSVTCHPAVAKLIKRRTQPFKLKDVTGAFIFLHLMSDANARQPTGLVVGQVYSGGKKYSMDLEADVVLDRLNDLMNLTKYEYKVLMIEPGLWEVSIYEKVGRDLTDTVVLIPSLDMDGPPEYSEDDTDFANCITATGRSPESDYSEDGGSQPDDEWNRKPKATYMDRDSVAEYGLAEDIIDFPDTTDIATLLNLAHEEVNKRKEPQRTVQFNLNSRRRLWGQFSDGDIVAVHLPFYAFTGLAVPVRILGREVNDSNESMTVAGEVVTGSKAEGLSMYKFSHYGAAESIISPKDPLKE